MRPARSATPPTVRQVRDLSIWSDTAGNSYVVACDANAGIGLRPSDFLRREPEEVGYSATKVPLMEVLAAGAQPILIINTLCLPLDGYGSRIVDGVRQAVTDAGLTVPVTGSDETNMTTVQTGIGVTVIGVAAKDSLRIGRAAPADVVLCAGYPRSGLPDAPYTEGHPDVAAPRDVLDVSSGELANEILPVGSKGVLAELRQLADTVGLDFDLSASLTVPLNVSAGASTCFLISCPPNRLGAVTAATRLPVSPVATLRRSASRPT